MKDNIEDIYPIIMIDKDNKVYQCMVGLTFLTAVKEELPEHDYTVSDKFITIVTTSYLAMMDCLNGILKRKGVDSFFGHREDLNKRIDQTQDKCKRVECRHYNKGSDWTRCEILQSIYDNEGTIVPCYEPREIFWNNNEDYPRVVSPDKIEENEATKHDNDKFPLELLPTLALEEVSNVLSYGSIKYGEHNWLKGMKWSRLIGATLRHIFAFIRGENTDKESGCPHLAHAVCNLLFLLEYIIVGLGTDDRYKGEKNE